MHISALFQYWVFSVSLYAEEHYTVGSVTSLGVLIQYAVVYSAGFTHYNAQNALLPLFCWLKGHKGTPGIVSHGLYLNNCKVFNKMFNVL